MKKVSGNDVVHAVNSYDIRKNISDRSDLVNGLVTMTAESKHVTQIISSDTNI